MLGAVSPLEFARRFLGFWPDEAQARVLERGSGFPANGAELQQAMGKIDGGGGARGASTVLCTEGDGAGGGSFGQAVGGDAEEGGGVFGGAWTGPQDTGGQG